ncbi:twin-arginine translocation pathway signal protein [Ruegeria sp. 2205SS24-7]|uniref:Acg family FMN-binding oxidoreductase n=1 Tax=Ruegeria discodermiae TaxID=3064389 RepID=UPI0027406DDE|nr:twin-arginine translocation pathway signal protein [Ruegeria sp. 2205SS24-7]MDP5218647.1 twin-arginine translocation pathway signal protein [Ruegeria sp. 2205SS24-7]
MTLSRRKTLALLGGGAVVAAGAATAGFVSTRTPQDALRPWSLAGQYSDPRKRALSYAILAPNPHNRQPWLVDLRHEDKVTLYVDTNRLLPHTDPFSRQIIVGLGCFLELLSIAAAQDGYRVAFDLFPDGEPGLNLDNRPVAVARFIPETGGEEPDLFAQILNRRSLKEPYDMARPVGAEVLTALEQAVDKGSDVATTNTPGLVQNLRNLTADALQVEFETPHTYKESVDLFRIGKREVNANPDGLNFSGPMWEMMRLTGLFSREAALDRDGFAYSSGLDMVRGTAQASMAYIWLASDENSRTDQIAAGRDWVRLNLAATAQGLGVQPMSQALQEFPEMAGQYQKVHELLAPDGGTVQMLGRLGYGPQVPQSPRWPLDAKVRTV